MTEEKSRAALEARIVVLETELAAERRSRALLEDVLAALLRGGRSFGTPGTPAPAIPPTPPGPMPVSPFAPIPPTPSPFGPPVPWGDPFPLMPGITFPGVTFEPLSNPRITCHVAVGTA